MLHRMGFALRAACVSRPASVIGHSGVRGVSVVARRGHAAPRAWHTARFGRSTAVTLPGRDLRWVKCFSTATSSPGEVHTYQAEVDRLLDMIVNSLYSNREVFIRELVSNASDALDKVRLLALQNADEYQTGDVLEIRVSCDKEKQTITIEDTGVGMTHDELISSLGTIARSGTAKFMEAMKEKGDANLIGQFGVGFYSAFLVADRVTVQTKSNASGSQVRWESSAGTHSYKIVDEGEGDIARGTRVTLHLKPDAVELADAKKLGDLVKQYSEFIAFPIKLWAESSEYEQVVDEDATKAAQEEEDAKAKEEGREAATVEPILKGETVTKEDWKIQNDNKPLWTRSARDVTREEQNAFFKSTFKEFVDPLAVSQFNVEGTYEFAALLCVPGMPPFDQSAMAQKSRNIRLYVKRVFISDEFDEDLLPRWANFVKGVVDSQDLPLNVSREILQESRVVRAIKRQLVKRTLDMLQDIAGREDPKEFETFWESFGRYIKVGVIEDEANRVDLAKLMRFASSTSGDKLTSLTDYVSRMKEDQKQIYFLIAPNKEFAEQSPYVEGLKKKGCEVLFLMEPMDEIVMMNLVEFEGKQFTDVAREDAEAATRSEEAKKALQDVEEELKPLTSYMKMTLGDKVEKVVVSDRLTDSPAIVVLSKFGWSSNMERIARAQAMGEPREAEYMRGRRILEINPDHPIIKIMQEKVDLDSTDLKEHIRLLYDAAALAGGYDVQSPKDFASRVYALLAGSKPPSGAAEQPRNEVIEPEVMA